MNQTTLQFGSSEILRFDTVQEGLKTLGDSAPSGQQNLEARVANPSLFGTFMDSRDIRLYGGVNDDRRCRFREDFSSDLTPITSAKINADGSVSINPDKYAQSHGTEFILIGKGELTGTTDNYAISSKKYDDDVKAALNAARDSGQGFSVDELVKSGGFKVNTDLAVVEHIRLKEGRNILNLQREDINKLSLGDFEYIHGGWHSHFIGFNDPTVEQELEGAKLYVRHLQEAVKNNCFTNNGKGMGFYVETGVKDYKARSWYVNYSDFRSGAGDGYLNYLGRFLRVRGSVAAGGGGARNIRVENAHEVLLGDRQATLHSMNDEKAAFYEGVVSAYRALKAQKQ